MGDGAAKMLTGQQAADKARAEKLEKAAALVQEVAEGLNAKGHVCGACGLKVKEDFFEASMRKTLEGIVERLGGFAFDLHAEADGTPDDTGDGTPC